MWVGMLTLTLVYGISLMYVIKDMSGEVIALASRLEDTYAWSGTKLNNMTYDVEEWNNAKDNLLESGSAIETSKKVES